MAKDRNIICEYYVEKGDCRKGIKDASISGRCRNCGKYRPKKGALPFRKNLKGRKLAEIRHKEDRTEKNKIY